MNIKKKNQVTLASYYPVDDTASEEIPGESHDIKLKHYNDLPNQLLNAINSRSEIVEVI